MHTTPIIPLDITQKLQFNNMLECLKRIASGYNDNPEGFTAEQVCQMNIGNMQEDARATVEEVEKIIIDSETLKKIQS